MTYIVYDLTISSVYKETISTKRSKDLRMIIS